MQTPPASSWTQNTTIKAQAAAHHQRHLQGQDHPAGFGVLQVLGLEGLGEPALLQKPLIPAMLTLPSLNLCISPLLQRAGCRLQRSLCGQSPWPLRQQTAEGDELPGEAQAILRVEEDVVQLILHSVGQWPRLPHRIVLPKSIQDVRVEQDLVGLLVRLLVREELLQKLLHAAAELSDASCHDNQWEPRCHQQVLGHVSLGGQELQDLGHLHLQLRVLHREA